MKDKMSIIDHVITAAVRLIEDGLTEKITIYNYPDREKINIENFKHSMTLIINREVL